MKNLKLIRILILEDDIETVSVITDRIAIIDNKLQETTICITVLSEYYQVQEYISTLDKNRFNIILLDRDCAAGGSFHELNIEEIGPEKIISISSMPAYNETAKKRGISKIVLKDFKNLNAFVDRVTEYIEDMIEKEKTLYVKAKELGIFENKLSAAMLQRELQIGYAMAARILDELELEGFVGPQNGAQPRVVLKSDLKSRKIVN